jgi:mannan endo-1,4-beta-mannosidase
MMRVVLSIVSVAVMSIFAADRYEAEDAIVDENSIVKVADAGASGGVYISMKEGSLAFKMNVASAGYYTLWTQYKQPNDKNGKIQNLSVNGTERGQISFPYTETFALLKASAKIKLSQGENTVSITKSWGWVDIDFAEITPYVETPFSISASLVNPNASVNAKKVYGFLLENFQKKIISGVMTNTVMQTDGKYTPNTYENQVELAWILEKSGKLPALVGLDFMHSTGKGADGEWYKGYTKATIGLARDVYRKGGIPAYCWHWKDPLKNVETFYSPSSGNSPTTSFNLKNAFTDTNTCATFNTGSPEYRAIIADIDTVSMYLKSLADSGVAVLWRPLHEASGKWFWWGYQGAKPCVSLYRLLFDRMTNYHKLNNLIWVWTTDEAGDALDWYPGDDYVDIVGRDYYYYPRVANHGSLVASFEKVKDIYKGKKLIALSENGSVPHPDSLKGDKAGWSYFMPWYGDYTMDGWAHDNTADDWKAIMNNEYVITLDKMPGWSEYTVGSCIPLRNIATKRSIVNVANGKLFIRTNADGCLVELFNVQGKKIMHHTINLSASLDIRGLTAGTYFVKVSISNTRIISDKIVVR